MASFFVILCVFCIRQALPYKLQALPFVHVTKETFNLFSGTGLKEGQTLWLPNHTVIAPPPSERNSFHSDN